MKKIIILAIGLWISCLQAYEFSMANLSVPTGLEKGQFEAAIFHRFYGDVTEDPLDTMFGLDVGANVSFKIKYQIFDNFDADFQYQRRQKEKRFGLAYKLEFDDIPVKFQPELHYFRYKEVKQEDEYAANMDYGLAIQSEEIADMFVFTGNVGYDGYLKRMYSGFGVTYTLFDDIFVFGEYYPVLDRDSASERLKQYLGEDDAYLFGIFLQTYGHKFIFTLSNNENIGLRRASLGTEDSSIYKLGFNIQRRF